MLRRNRRRVQAGISDWTYRKASNTDQEWRGRGEKGRAPPCHKDTKLHKGDDYPSAIPLISSIRIRNTITDDWPS